MLLYSTTKRLLEPLSRSDNRSSLMNDLVIEAARQRGAFWIPTRGNCMGARLRDSYLLIEPVGDWQPRSGELAAYLVGDQRITVHRLCRQDAAGWWAIPDNRFVAERTGSLLGRVRLMYRDGITRELLPRPGWAWVSWFLDRLYQRWHNRGCPFGSWLFAFIMRIKRRLTA